jgi:hypothetical protein
MQVPEHLVAEIIDGELVASPRPASPHARAHSSIGQDLSPFDRKPGQPGAPGGWWILDEPELHFGEDVLVPDLAGWGHERMPAIPTWPFSRCRTGYVKDLPSTGRIDRFEEDEIYAREGVDISGSSIRSRTHWKRIGRKTAAGSSRARTATRPSARRSTRSDRPRALVARRPDAETGL